jgi:hypothetical protein
VNELPGVRQSIVTALVELVLTVAAYVLLKPLIGYWCLVPVAILGYLTVIGTITALALYAATSAPDPRDMSEQKKRRKRIEEIVLLAAVGVFLLIQPFIMPLTTMRVITYAFTVLVFVQIFVRKGLTRRQVRASTSLADAAPPESDQSEGE